MSDLIFENERHICDSRPNNLFQAFVFTATRRDALDQAQFIKSSKHMQLPHFSCLIIFFFYTLKQMWWNKVDTHDHFTCQHKCRHNTRLVECLLRNVLALQVYDATMQLVCVTCEVHSCLLSFIDKLRIFNLMLEHTSTYFVENFQKFLFCHAIIPTFKQNSKTKSGKLIHPKLQAMTNQYHPLATSIIPNMQVVPHRLWTTALIPCSVAYTCQNKVFPVVIAKKVVTFPCSMSDHTKIIFISSYYCFWDFPNVAIHSQPPQTHRAFLAEQHSHLACHAWIPCHTCHAKNVPITDNILPTTAIVSWLRLQCRQNTVPHIIIDRPQMFGMEKE